MLSKLALAFGIAASTGCLAQPPRYRATFIPSADPLIPYAMSRSGVVAGTRMGGNADAFAWQEQLQIYSAPVSSDGAWTFGANDFGWVVGYVDQGALPRPFIADPQNGLRTFEPLGSPDGVAWSVNNNGVVVGTARNGVGGHWAPFIWSSSSGATPLPFPPTALGGAACSINQVGVIAGGYQVEDGMRPCRWIGGTFESLPLPPGFGVGRGRSVNDLGVVVGVTSPDESMFPIEGVLWSSGQGIILPGLGGGTTIPNALNDAGQIVGEAWDSIGRQFAVTWTGGEIHRLEDLLDGVGSAELVMARGIDEYGRIAALGTIDGVFGAVILSPVPGPAPSLVLLMGWCAGAFSRHRRQC
jgi:uncharacterized membrane protein